MKKLLLFLVFIPSIIVAEDEIYSRFYPEGTTWTELVLDTLAHDSWFSKEGDNWVANYETVTYYVKGQWDFHGSKLNCVYTQIAGEPDSLAFYIEDPGTQDMAFKLIWAGIKNDDNYCTSSELYDFDWIEGKSLYGQPMVNHIFWGGPVARILYGTIEKIEEGDFGGVQPLNYVDLTAQIWYKKIKELNREYPVRMIQGIGVTTWDGPQCILGPIDVSTYLYKPGLGHKVNPDSHHRSMLVHFERNGEILYDVWPSPEGMTNEVKYVLTPKPENDTPILFDLSGRRLEQKPAKGIYIQGGKTILVK
ncbi:MAG: hypothetical protein J5661_05935 [Bacteroidaceae bacterium]|nr:hypothetical protein [Bacteroidaceae bacterium]